MGHPRGRYCDAAEGSFGVSMGSRGSELDGQSTADSTPEDVAALYSWANLRGAKYRDYSASRREYRAQVRYRAAKALLERELKAQAEADRTENGIIAALQAQSVGVTAEGTRKTAADRVEAARRSEAAARAAVLALREEREITEAHISARRQALIYEETEERRRELAGPQPFGLPGNDSGGQIGDLQREAPQHLNRILNRDIPDSVEGKPAQTWTGEVQREVLGRAASEAEQTGPAWLYSFQSEVQPHAAQAATPSYAGGSVSAGEVIGGDTLQDSRERVAARWFALKGVFDQSWPELSAMQPVRTDGGRTRLLAVFSLAGGVGKTSLVATLGRALARQGEKVVVADTAAEGLLPIHFGVREVRAGELRVFPARTQNGDPPVSLVTYDIAGRGLDERQQEDIAEEILRRGQGSDRMLLDLSAGLSWMVRRMVDLHPTVLVPMAPDMNSVLSLQAVERMFRGIIDSDGRPLLPFYVLNQFDATLALHLDVREVLRRQLGERLVRFAIRRSAVVSEALAEGMTVVDYAPAAPVAQDFLDVALWLRSVSPPAAELRGASWGEP